jgi:hypothetical protein
MSGFRCRVNEIFALLGCYATHIGTLLQTSWTTYWTLQDGADRLIRNAGIYQSTLPNIPEEWRFCKSLVPTLTERIIANSGSHSANKASCVLMPSGLVGVWQCMANTCCLHFRTRSSRCHYTAIKLHWATPQNAMILYRSLDLGRSSWLQHSEYIYINRNPWPIVTKLGTNNVPLEDTQYLNF